MSFSRRRFFLGSGAAAAVSAGASLSPVALQAATRPRRPRRIIHLVSDGMSLGTLSCGDQFSRMIRGRPLAWVELYRRPGVAPALVNMRSLNSIVTDSAAASSSWGSGSRVQNGSLNILPDKRELRPLAMVFAEAGWARGLVTTTEITHATPAGFAANAEDRGTAPLIAQQYLERRLDLLLGGGRQYFEAANRKDKRDLKAEFRAWGYEVLEHRSALLAASTKHRWLGLFAGGHLPYSVDQAHSLELQTQVPTLAEMTRRALEHLGERGNFLLQIEGGRVDHGAHANDAAAALFDQLAFDDALAVVLDFQRREPDTLVVVTTDHGTANLGLSGMGSNYAKSPVLFANLTKVRCSFGEIQKALTSAAGKGAVGEKKYTDGRSTRSTLNIEPTLLALVLQECTGYEVPARLAEGFARYLAAESEPLFEAMDSLSGQLGQLLANYLGVSFIGGAHSSDYVPLVAVGPGAERFAGFIQNTDVFRHYTDLAQIRFRNPETPLLAEVGPTAAEAENWAIV